MRKLGKGQAVAFCATEEIQMKLRACTSTPHDKTIEVRIPNALSYRDESGTAALNTILSEAHLYIGDMS